RSVSPFSTRHRAHFNFDSRTQTAYGTLRTYVAVHIDNLNQGSVTVNPTRAFIQWAGFTFGHTKSFSDVPGTPAADSFRSLHQAWGRFGVSAIFNKVNATYYTSTATGLGNCPVGQTGTSGCGFPDDKWGWAVLSGIDIKAPWAGPGDHFGGFFDYGVGAAAYS